jgi:tetratricopeptide (TPR) repeat protein
MEKQAEESRAPRFLLPALALLAAAAAARQLVTGRVYSVQDFSHYADRGEMLFHAFADKAVSYSMPLLSLLVSTAQYHLGFHPAALVKAAGLLLCLPAYAIGARGGGRARGALFALAVLAVNLGYAAQEAEQTIYSLTLLTFLSAELLRQARGGLALAGLSGLAAGVTLLVRSPLFAFPPLAAAFHYFSGRPAVKKWLLASGLLLACAYLPLVPWARLNYGLFGRIIPFEEERSTCNIITGAAGIIYTIEGDARAYAGLSRTESPYPWALKKIAGDPLNYAGAVVKRLWQTLLMFPALFLLAGLGLFLARRRREARFIAFLSGYYVLLHCLLSIEERYFFPLRYLLALLAAGGAWELLARSGLARDEAAPGERLTPALTAVLGLAAALTLGLVWRYPSAARPGLIAAQEELAKHPGDAWLHKKKGEILLELDLTAPGLASLREACLLGAGHDVCWLTGALDGIPDNPPRYENHYELLLIKTLRDLQLGRLAEGAETFSEAEAFWRTARNGIKAIPYEADKAHLRRIRETNKTLWDMDLYNALFYFRPAERPEILRRLGRLTPLTPRLNALIKEPSGRENEGYDLTLAYTGALLARPRLAPAPDAALPPAEGAFMRALAAAAGRGELPRLLMTAAPTPGQAAWLYLNSASPEAAAAGEGPLPAAVRFLALQGRDGGGMVKALRRAPLVALAAARELAGTDPAGARTLIGTALSSAERFESARAEAALLYQELGDHAASAALNRALLGKNPGYPGIHNNLGVSLLFLGREREAEAAFRRALDAEPGAFSPALNLAALLSRRGDTAGAERFYRAALANPALPRAERGRVERELAGKN